MPTPSSLSNAALLESVHRHLDELLMMVDDAGRLIMDVYRRAEPVAVSLKSDDSPVTEADILANTLLVERLRQCFPDLPIVTEEASESFAHRHPEKPFWLLDPLDGTREFINRTDQFTVNVALVVGGLPVVGVVAAPALNQLYWAIESVGSFARSSGTMVALQAASFPERLPAGGFATPVRLLASQNHLSEETRRFIEAIQPHQLHQAGSSLKFCRLAEGAADCYPRHSPTCEWDTAAGQAVLEIAGGSVRRLDGSRLTYGAGGELNPSFIATGTGGAWPLD
ncbi:MAG: 3'(2'),5'-bisphosphate nucleotidase CysQ [Burkholderiaceae bacterium]